MRQQRRYYSTGVFVVSTFLHCMSGASDDLAQEESSAAAWCRGHWRVSMQQCNVESAKAFLTPDRALPKSTVGGRKEDLRAISGTFQGGNMMWTMGLGAGSSCATKKMGQGRKVIGPR